MKTHTDAVLIKVENKPVLSPEKTVGKARWIKLGGLESEN